jgi:predicted short-subunit dehydrogenase-like oxidoreductase (DUF2520 family)
MIKVTIIGSGNVAQHLIKAFIKSEVSSTEVQLVQVFSRQVEKVIHLIDESKICTQLTQLLEVDLYIIAVSDGAISEISKQIPHSNRLVVHVSGSVPLVALSNKNRKGVFYPLQTFTANKELDFSNVPICIETETEIDNQLLKNVAHCLSELVYEIDTVQRKALHVAAVFVNNFVNHLYKIGGDICDENGVPFDILYPLIQETANKIALLSPEKSQTGPAKRKDMATIESHLSFLENQNQKKIYQILTQSILENGEKL